MRRFPAKTTLLKSLIATAIIAILPLKSFADDAKGANEVFKTACVKTWMEHAGKSKDTVSYKNFGEKYCDCASSQNLENDAAINKATQLCMSQTLLHDAMDSMGDQHGLKNLDEEKIKAGCVDEWAIINPDMDAKTKETATHYCACAAPKLNEMNNNRDSMTDKDWADKIKSVATSCANIMGSPK